MSVSKILITVAIMSIITYLVRVIPLLVFRKPIKNKYVSSFLTYLPYGVLTAMIIPDIFTSTAGIISGAIGAIVAIILAYFKRGLVIVALGATAAVYLTELLITLF